MTMTAREITALARARAQARRRLETQLRAQHAVADAQCAFHAQLAAVFRGDARQARRAHEDAARHTMRAIALARAVLGESVVDDITTRHGVR